MASATHQRNLPSAAVEAVRCAFRGGVELQASELVDRLQASHGYKRTFVYNIVSSARATGLVTRLGQMPNHRYALNTDWDPSVLGQHTPRGRRHTQRHWSLTAPAQPYAGPAFGDTPLVQALGRICGNTPDPRELPATCPAATGTAHTTTRS